MAGLSIDAEMCTGHGRCFDAAPDLIEPDELGLGRVVVADVPAAFDEAARRAALACPERAISYTEDPT